MSNEHYTGPDRRAQPTTTVQRDPLAEQDASFARVWLAMQMAAYGLTETQVLDHEHPMEV